MICNTNPHPSFPHGLGFSWIWEVFAVLVNNIVMSLSRFKNVAKCLFEKCQVSYPSLLFFKDTSGQHKICERCKYLKLEVQFKGSKENYFIRYVSSKFKCSSGTNGPHRIS